MQRSTNARSSGSERDVREVICARSVEIGADVSATVRVVTPAGWRRRRVRGIGRLMTG
jgi:hypothetical protein